MDNQIYTIQGAVMSVLNELEAPNFNAEFARLLQFGIEGYSYLNLFNGLSVDVAYLTMNEANIVTLPHDYECYLKVAINLNGRLWTLTKDENIILPEGVVLCDTPLHQVNNASGEYGLYPFTSHTRYDGKYISTMYAIGGGFNISYFREDKRNKTLVFTNAVPQSQIIVEYMSNGANASGTSTVKAVWFETLKRWIHWKRIKDKRNYSAADKHMALRLFEDARDLSIATETMLPMDEWLDLMSSSYNQSIKR